jgi:hypothetical protein
MRFWRQLGMVRNGAAQVTDDPNSQGLYVAGILLDAAYLGFTRGKIIDNELAQPGYGYTIAYHGGPQGEATIYIYDKGYDDIPDGPVSEVVLTEFDQATQEALSLQPAGRSLELVDRYGTGSPERGREFLCAVFVVRDGLEPRRSYLYLTGANGNFVKIRITLHTNDAADPTARIFADSVATRLWRRSGAIEGRMQ